MLVEGTLQGIVQLHVGVQRVVLGTGMFLGDGIVEGCRDLPLVGEQLADFEVGGQRIGLVRVGIARCHTVLQSTEALSDYLSRQIDGADIGQLYVECSRGSPATLVDHVDEAQLVDPHLAGLDGAGQVAHTNHHGLHLAERRVTHDADAVVLVVGVVVGIERGEAGRTHGAGLVAGLLQLGEQREVDVEHVLQRPHGTAVVGIEPVVVVAVGGELQGDDVLVVVVLIVTAQTDEDGQLVILQRRGIVDEVVGMDEHLHVAVEAQVEGGVAVDGLRLAAGEILHHHVEGLLVGLGELGLRGVGDARDARRQHVVDGAFVVVFLNIDGTDLQRTAVGAGGQGLVVDAPLATHQFEGTEAQHDGALELSKEHAHEADAGKVGDATFATGVLRQGDAELIPLHRLMAAVAQRDTGLADVGDEVLSQLHVLRTDAHLILEVTLILVQRVVLVDVLHVGIGLVGGVVALRLLLAVGGVALRHVDALVSLQDVGAPLVQVGAAEVVVVVVGRVGIQHGTHTVIHADLVEEGGIGGLGALFGIVESVESQILQGARPTGGGKSVGLGGLHGNLTPCRLREVGSTVDRHAAFVELLAVAQDILAHLTEVDVQVAAIVEGIALLIAVDEGVHEPELDVLDIGSLEVIGVQLAHHAAPPLLRIAQRTVEVDIGGQVVGTALLGIEGQVEHGQGIGGTVVGGLVAVGIELADVDAAHVVVGQHGEVALDVAGGQTGGAVGEQRVDVIPRQQGAVEAAGDGVLVDVLGKHGRHAGDDPRLGFGDIDAVLGILEVVDVGGVVLRAACRTGYELCKLAGEGNLRRCGTVQQGQLVQHAGEPLALCLPVDVDTPQRVLQRFGTHDYLRREGLFGEVLQRTAYLEIL